MFFTLSESDPGVFRLFLDILDVSIISHIMTLLGMSNKGDIQKVRCFGGTMNSLKTRSDQTLTKSLCHCLEHVMHCFACTWGYMVMSNMI